MSRLFNWPRFLLLWLPVILTPAAVGANAGRDLVQEKVIEQKLEQLDPTLVEPFRAARVAIDRDDYASAERLLTPICAQLPTFDPALRRLGVALGKLGQRQASLARCEQAVTINRSAANLETLAYVLSSPPNGKPLPADEEHALHLLQEATRLPGGDDVSDQLLLTQLAFSTQRLDVAREAVRRLRFEHPEEMGTHFYAAYIAANDGAWIAAENEMREAGKLGAPEAAVRAFLDSGVHQRALGWRLAWGTAILVGGWILGLGALAASGILLSKVTLRSIDRVEGNLAVTAGEHRIRKFYRYVLNVAGVYYYLSLPIVLLLVIAVSAAIVYACLAAGFLPIKLLLVLGIGALATIGSMIKSLFLRVRTEDPGRVLDRAEAEGLWQLTQEVAKDVNTRPIDEIRLTPGTELAVYERGSWREKMENKATRVLILGTAVLADFKQEDFRSVLAHEYGHFSHRDTAGGDVAMRVQNDIIKFYRAMLAAGQATKTNLAFHFLRAYHFIFRRISRGATRLQEVLADRVAAQTYGAPAFEGGLRHVIRRSIEFDRAANREIEEAIKAKRPLSNFYHPTVPSDANSDAFDKAINRPTTEDDTHPGPQDRFRRIAPFQASSRPPAPGLVWDLFKDRDAIMKEMVETIEKRIARHRD
jgi:tetratricopeptide (TPR) repeat protein